MNRVEAPARRRRSLRLWTIAAALLGGSLAGRSVLALQGPPSRPAAQSAAATQTVSNRTDCNVAMKEPIEHVPVPSPPLHVLTTRDGCALFLRTQQGLSVYRRVNGVLLETAPPTPVAGLGSLALTHDQSMLVVRARGEIVFFDVKKLVSGDPKPVIGSIKSPRFGSTGMSFPSFLITPDDRHLLATHHETAWLSVISLDRVRADGPGEEAIIGGTATSEYPTDLQLSPDGRVIYLAQGRAATKVPTPSICRASYQPRPEQESFRRSGISVIDLATLLTRPEQSFIAEFAAGCETSVMRLSPDGNRLYSLSHGDNALSVFDVSGPSRANLRHVGTIPVGRGPRDVVVLDEGRTAVVSHGNELGEKHEFNWLTVIDTSRAADGADAVRGIIPTRDRVVSMWVTADDRTLLVPNRESRTLEVVDLDRMPLMQSPVREPVKP